MASTFMQNFTFSPERRRWWRRLATGLLWASPAIMGFLLLYLGPMVASLGMSFTNWKIVDTPKWIGFENWVTMLTADPLFYQSLRVSATYALISVPLRLVLALMIALMMNQKHRLVSVFRMIYYLPSVIAGVSVALLWSWVFHPEFGVINTLLYDLFGIQGPRWLFDPDTALASIIIMSLWSVGGSMLVYLGGLQGVPTDLYDAAEVDGAGTFARFWNVTLPMITPVLFFNVVMGFINSFQAFTEAFVMTGGGPMHSTRFFLLHLYQNAFVFFRMGYAAALSWALFVIILLLTIAIFRSSTWWVYYEGEKNRG
jgi:multiple sugar transport system permease protein